MHFPFTIVFPPHVFKNETFPEDKGKVEKSKSDHLFIIWKTIDYTKGVSLY